jgi:dTDP-4-amino-4,6-dideoxygalactose transaminase
MPWRIPLSDAPVDPEAVAAARETLESGWWSMGPRVQEFEEAFAERCGVPRALAVANGTAALQLALLATGCGPGDQVVLPSLTFVAAANAVVHAGARPVFCDIRGEHDLNLDPEDLAGAIGESTRAIVTLHYGGHPYDVDAVNDLARDAGIVVVEDAAHAPGASADGRAAGSLGTVGCFSFFSNKNLPIGEGGMLVTADEEIAERARLLRSHGMTTLTWDRHRGHAHEYDVLVHGLNLRLDEVRAAIGLVHLRRLPEWNAERGRLVGLYREALCDEPALTIPFGERPAGTVSSHHLMVVVLAEGIPRDRVRAALAEDGIQTSVHYPPIHRFTAFRDAAGRPLPRTDGVADRLLTLPLYPGLGDAGVELVCDRLRAALQSAVTRVTASARHVTELGAAAP